MKVPLATLLLGLTAGFLLAFLLRSGPSESGNTAEHEAVDDPKKPTRVRTSRQLPGLSSTPSLAELEMLMRQSRDGASKARLTLAIYGLNGDQIHGVMDELRVKVDSGKADPNAYSLQSQLLGAWMELNPSEALAWIDETPSTNSRQQLYAMALSGLAESDPNAAIALLSVLPEDLSRASIEQRMMWSVLRSDPDAALDYYRSNPDQSVNNRLSFLQNLASYRIDAVIPELEKLESSVGESRWAADNIFKTWAKQDLDALRSYIESTESDVLKTIAIEAAAGQLAITDPVAAIEMADLLDDNAKAKGMGSVYSAWMDREPEVAMASLSAMDDDKLRDEICGALLDKLDWQNPGSSISVIALMSEGDLRTNAVRQIQYRVRRLPYDEQRKLIDRLPDSDRGPFLAGMASELVRTDLERGLEVYHEMSEKDRAGREGIRFLQSLAKADPDRALELANELPNAAARNQAISSLVQNLLSYSSPEQAAGIIDKLEGEQRAQAVSALARSWASRDVDKALVWAEGLSGAGRVDAMVAISMTQSSREPVEAAAVFETALASATVGMKDKMRHSVYQVAKNYAKEDAASAAQWSVTLETESAAKSAVASSIEVWSSEDPTAASEWINTLQAGPVRDAAVKPMVTSIQNEQPNAALEWAASIRNRKERELTMKATLKNWVSHDRDAARRGLDNAGLDQSIHAELLKLFE